MDRKYGIPYAPEIEALKEELKMIIEAEQEKFEMQLIYLLLNGHWPESKTYGPDLKDPVLHSVIYDTDLEGIPIKAMEPIIGPKSTWGYTDLLQFHQSLSENEKTLLNHILTKK